MFKYKIAVEPILLFLLFFTEMFSFKIGNFNTRYAVIFFWLAIGLVRSRKLSLCKGSMTFAVGIVSLLAYSVLIIIAMRSGESFIPLRYGRALITCFTIYLWISTSNLSMDRLFDIVELILTLHAVCILLEIIYPPVKDIVQPISQYNKEFMRLRAPGFLSGYDDAGLLLVIGLVINYYRNKARERSAFSVRTFIYAAAVIFASRISMLILFLMLVYIIIIENRNGTWKSKLLIAFTLILGGGVAVLFWILTTDINIALREDLFVRFPILKSVYDGLMTSYTDYGTYRWQTFTRHWYPEEISAIQYIIGKGVWPERSDIGYIKNIYATGIISVLGILTTYSASFIRISKTLKEVLLDDIAIKYYTRMYGFVVLLMIAMEMKISILFSSTSFELLVILFFTLLLKAEESELSEDMLL
ncbi:MAG: hypothetical protein IKP88_02060 [Lachnospiraceae bacterium]|nr:hypothetical protein [Lachnospiraceae bacterium]